MSDGRSVHLRGSEIQLEKGLLEMMVGHGQTGALLSGVEEEEKELPEEGVFLGEIHGLGMGLEADASKDVICVGEEIAALSLRGTEETELYVVDARNAEQENRGQSERQRTTLWVDNTNARCGRG